MEPTALSFISLSCLTLQLNLFKIPLWNLDGLLYHEFEMARDSEGFTTSRVFENVNSGLVFELFYYLDVGAAPAILVVASDASFQGHMKQHPLYCKSDGIQL